MEFVLDPNVAYVLLVVGAFLGVLAIISPGTGMLEVGCAFCLFLAAYAVVNLDFNAWALGLLGLSLIPFGLAFRMRQRAILLGMTVIGLAAGSAFLFRAPNGAPAVNPVLAVTVSLAFCILMWIMATRSLDASHAPPLHNPDYLIGQSGETRTAVEAEGSVQVAGELWSARSQHAIPSGSPVRVVARDGFVLVVEPLDRPA